jgi:hypothetical protein
LKTTGVASLPLSEQRNKSCTLPRLAGFRNYGLDSDAERAENCFDSLFGQFAMTGFKASFRLLAWKKINMPASLLYNRRELVAR